MSPNKVHIFWEGHKMIFILLFFSAFYLRSLILLLPWCILAVNSVYGLVWLYSWPWLHTSLSQLQLQNGEQNSGKCSSIPQFKDGERSENQRQRLLLRSLCIRLLLCAQIIITYILGKGMGIDIMIRFLFCLSAYYLKFKKGYK